MAANITRERMGEIAIAMLKQKMAEDGVQLSRENLKRRLHNQTRRLGATAEELIAMAEILVREMVEETFAK
jgi:hypothetical protein